MLILKVLILILIVNKFYAFENFNNPHIVYYDREIHDDFITDNYIHHFHILSDIIKNDEIAKIRITLNNTTTIECYPIYLEFSKLTDCFSLIAFKENSKETILLNKIIEIKVYPNDTINKNKLTDKLKNTEQSSVSISFTNERNMPDRISNEFAPWKKIYEKQTSPYILTIYYDENDEDDIIRRLLSYGQYITINNKNSRISVEIERIKEMQREIFEDELVR